jgi:hypothetical protein
MGVFYRGGQDRSILVQTIIDFMPSLHCVLLGVKTFPGRSELAIDYPRRLFSARNPMGSAVTTR